MADFKKTNKQGNSSQGGKYNPAKTIPGLIVFALFWNGFVFWIYLAMLQALTKGGLHAIFILLFLTPFTGTGIYHLLIPLGVELLAALGFRTLKLDYSSKQASLPVPPPVVPSVAFWGGLVHLIAGAWLITTGLIPVVIQWNNMQGWVATPCDMLSSKVLTVWVDDEERHTTGVRYRYEYQGREYVTDKYAAYVNPWRSTKGLEKKLEKYPVGTTATCYVNPEQPEQAVLTRDIRGFKFLGGAMGSIIWFVGAIAFGMGTRSWGRRFPARDWRRPERMVFWILLLIGWGGFAGAMIIGDICDRVEKGLAATPAPGILLFFGGVGLVFIIKLFYNLLVSWDKAVRLSPGEFYQMYEQAKARKRKDSN